MRGGFYIDSRDAYADFGVLIEQYGYAGLIQYPAFKKLTATSWPDEDGDEVDLSEVQLDSKSFSMQFIIKDVSKAANFFETLTDGAYHDFEFPELGKTYKLRMSQNGSFSQNIRLGKLTLTFYDDFPQLPQSKPLAIAQTAIRAQGYEIDHIDISQFGALVLNGSEASIRQSPATKDNLKIDNKSIPGIIYDAEKVYFKTKDITLKLLINCDGINEFWGRYESLFAILLQSESRKFYHVGSDTEYNCYYKSCTVSKFDILRANRLWCEFSIVLTATSYYNRYETFLTANPDFPPFLTVDGSNFKVIKANAI